MEKCFCAAVDGGGGRIGAVAAEGVVVCVDEEEGDDEGEEC